MSHRQHARNITIGDFITNVSDNNPSWIGKVMSVSRRSYMSEIHVKVVKRPTSESQSNMPDSWDYPYDLAINVFRKLTTAEQLLYTLE